MQIAVLGSGKIGGTLGPKWAAAGHDLVYGVRDPSSPSNPVGEGARFVETGEAIAFGEVVVLAIPSGAVEDVVKEHAGALDGKVVVDTTNNFAGPETSRIAAIREHARSARIYRAFNYLGWENFAEPQFGDQRADLFYCGPDDAEGTENVEQLIREIGLRPIRVGDLDKVELVDNLLFLWYTLASEQGKGRRIAFKLLEPA